MPIAAAYIVPHPPVIVPEVGQGRESGISKTIESYIRAAREIAERRPETIVIFSPHSTGYADYIHIAPGRSAEGSMAKFGAPGVTKVRYDDSLASELEKLCTAEKFPGGTRGDRGEELDHGVLIPLGFINKFYTGYRILRVSPSGLSREEHYRFGMILKQAINSLGRNAILIASGDLSHRLTPDGPYGFAPEGPELDRKLTGIMESGEFGELFEVSEELKEKGADCGFFPMLMLAGALDRKAVKPELFSYEGPFGVGYAVASFRVLGEDPNRNFLDRREERAAREIQAKRQTEDAYVRLARTTLEHYVRTGETPPLPEDLPGELLSERAGVFVSIKKRGALRGCVGTITPAQVSLAEEIRHGATSSGTADPRFDPITEDELSELVYSVDVLGPAEETDESMLDPSRYGVIVTSEYKKGLLLPNLEGVETVKDQLLIARKKAGIEPDEECAIQRFEVVRHL